MPNEGATEVGSIVGYLILNRSDWTAGVAATKKDADQLGRLSPNIRIQTNTGEVLGQLALVQAAERKIGTEAKSAAKEVGSGPGIGLVGALLSIAPAAVPIGAVAGGALAGLIPTAATLALGVKGISNEMKAGSLQGTKYAHDMNQLKAELSEIETISAAGLLNGIDKGLGSSHALFSEVNDDTRLMAAQIGEIVGDSAPALLALLHDLSPLFATLGGEVEAGAVHFEHWATSSGDVSKFVDYVQAELPPVEQLLGQLLTLFGHLVQGAAPFGGVLVTDFTALARAINALPIGVLQVLIPLAISAKAAMLGYTAVTAVVNGVTAATTAMGAAWTGMSAEVIAAEVASQAAVDEAEANKAAAALASARVRLALVEGVSASLAEEAAADVAAAESIAASEAAKAAESQAAARAMAEANAEAGASMSAALGPIAALVIGGGLLATMFLHSGSSADAAAGDVNTFTQALIASNGVVNESVRSAVAKKLADDGVTDAARAQGLSLSDLASATLGNAAASDRLQASIDGQMKAWADLYQRGQITHKQYEQMQGQLIDVAQGVNHVAAAFGTSVQQQRDYAAEMRSGTVAVQQRQIAAAALYGLTGKDGVAAYEAAATAAKKNTEQTRQQTLAFQLENNAAGLVNEALQTLAGQNLSNAQAQTALDRATLTLTQSLKDNGSSVSDNTTAGVANREAIDGAAQALRAKMQAEASATGSTEKATRQYRDNASALLDQIGRLDGTKSAAYRYAQQLLKIPHVVKTKVDIQDDAVRAAIRDVRLLASAIASLPATQQINVGHRGEIAGRASGGGLPEGLAWVGEAGPELADKRGSSVQIIPHVAAVAYAHEAGLTVPGYADGTPGASASVKSFFHAAAATIVAAIRSAVRSEPTTIAGQRAALSQHIAGATSRQAVADAGRVDYEQLAARLHEVTKATNAHVAAARHEAVQAQIAANKAQALADKMPDATKAEKAAKNAAEDHAKALQHEAEVAGNVATKTEKAAQRKQSAAQKAADKAKTAYEKEEQAAKAAAQVVAQEAQAVMSSFSDQVSSMLQQISDFESSVSSGISMGNDLATVWGQITDGVSQAQSTLDSAKQTLAGATVDTSALADAQAAEAQAARDQAAAHDALTRALASGDPAAILAAQNAQTDAATRLAAAQQAVQAATPTPDQLKAQADAQQKVNDAQAAYNQAVAAQSDAGLQDKFNQLLSQAKHFVGDLNALASEGANQSFIEQIAGMGPAAGDALAQAILAAGPNGLSQLQDTMGQINTLAGKEGDSLAEGFFGTGVDSVEQLGEGMIKQFPELAAELAPYLAKLQQAFVFQATITGPDGNPIGGSTASGSGSGSGSGKGTSAADTAHYYLAHDPKTGAWWDVTDSGTVHLLTTAQRIADQAAGADVRTVSGRPKPMQGFATGGTVPYDMWAMVGEAGPEVVRLPGGAHVYPSNVSKGAAPFAGADITPLVNEVRVLIAEVRALPQANGREMAAAGAALYRQAGDAAALRTQRLVRKG